MIYTKEVENMNQLQFQKKENGFTLKKLKISQDLHTV